MNFRYLQNKRAFGLACLHRMQAFAFDVLGRSLMVFFLHVLNVMIVSVPRRECMKECQRSCACALVSEPQ